MTSSGLRALLIDLYYWMKPFIPERALLSARRRHVARLRERNAHIWPIDEGAGRPPQDWRGWPEGKRFALVLTHDVESARGQAKCRQLAELEMDLGFRSSFGFVPEAYPRDGELHRFLVENGFEVAVHGLTHRDNLFGSIRRFLRRAPRINHYLREWGAVGFRAPSMYHNLKWTHLLDVCYDMSTFDTDPFEPQPEGMKTAFPLWVKDGSHGGGYVELPYTLPQDSTLFLLLRERNPDVWKRKLDWIVAKGAMALMLTHPDYMSFDAERVNNLTYPTRHYESFLQHIKEEYAGAHWHALPRDVAAFWSSTYGTAE